MEGESCLWHIFWLQPDLVVCTLQINPTEDSRALQLVKQLIYAWQRITILDSLFV